MRKTKKELLELLIKEVEKQKDLIGAIIHKEFTSEDRDYVKLFTDRGVIDLSIRGDLWRWVGGWVYGSYSLTSVRILTNVIDDFSKQNLFNTNLEECNKSKND